MEYETNSKLVKKGDTFVAIIGNHFDGHNFIDEAIKNGANKIIVSRKIKLENKNVKIIYVKDTNKFLNRKISKENRKLSKDIKIIGITGTKGKSTTAMLCFQMLKCMKINAAYIGTLGLYYKDNFLSLDNTTPDILTINKILKLLNKESITHIVMEVSSHSLILKRIEGLKLKIAAFTNLSQDHLDFHKNMYDYLKAKLKIFKYLDGTIIINNDDEYANIFKKKAKKYVTIGKNGIFQIKTYTLYETNTIINFSYNYNNYTISIPLVGKYNIYNYLEALAIMISLNFNILDLINITNNLKGVKGRNELIKSKKGYVVIDYAHSPNSVKETLETYNELKKGKIITIVGCGGNRDKTKRPIMGKIATTYSDYVIFTSDNPRDENPKDILNDITNGIESKNFEVIENRKNAIKKGVKLLNKNDYLLILGKGHEDYQIIKNVKHHFDDKEEVMKWL